MPTNDESNLPKGKGAGEVLPFSDPVPDAVVRVGYSLASVEAIVRDRAEEWKRFCESDTGKHGQAEKALCEELIKVFDA